MVYDNIEKPKPWEFALLSSGQRRDLTDSWAKRRIDKQIERITCECGGNYQHRSRSKHYKTKNHAENMRNRNVSKGTANVSKGTVDVWMGNDQKKIRTVPIR